MLALGLLLLGASGFFLEPMHRMRVDYALTSEPVKGVSPQLVLATTALGAFRGIMVDVLWIRMESLKQEGKFFELTQLADWACKLAPRFYQVWEYNAWNLAYNVSVEIPTLSERWAWVRSGIELLRDEAIPLNPNEPTLYYRLAHIYFHKVGKLMDDAHMLYKREVCLQMHEILGGSGTREQLEALDEAPKTEEELLKDPRVAALNKRCLEEGLDLLDSQRFFGWARRPDSVAQSVQGRLMAAEHQEPLELIRTYHQARRLREELRLDVKKMMELVDEYGPVDWRTAQPQAIYWATQAKEVAERAEKRRAQLADERAPELRYRYIDYERVIYGAVQDIVKHGRLLFNADGRLLSFTGPDYRFVDTMIRQFEKVIEQFPEIQGTRDALEYFLRRTARNYYFMGDVKKAEQYWFLLKEKYPKDEYKISLPEFANNWVTETAGVGHATELDHNYVRTLVRSDLSQSLLYLGSNADDLAAMLEGRAKRVATRWNTEMAATWEKAIIHYDKILDSVLTDVFNGQARFPPGVVANLRTRLGEDVYMKYRRLPEQEGKPTVPFEEIPEELLQVPAPDE